MTIKTLTLDNGLKSIVRTTPQMQTFGMALGVNYGSVDENPRVNGAAHYLEHMLFKGTKRRTWKEINEEARARGMYQNAFTGKESTTYVLQAHKGYFKQAVGLLSDVMINSTFPEKEFELERGPIINENMMRNDSPLFMLYNFIPKALYKKHPAKMSITGCEATIKRTTRHDVLEIYDKFYSPMNMILSVCGAVDANRAFDIIKEHFKDFDKDNHAPKRNVAREKQEKRSITILKNGIKQTRLGIGFKCNGQRVAEMEEYLSMGTVAEILTKRIFDEVREKRGLSYDPKASYFPYGTFGFIAVTAGVEPTKINETKEVVLKEFEKLQKGEIEKGELDKRKKALSIAYRVGRDSTLQTAELMAYSELTLGNASIVERMPKLIKTVTLDDVREYCEKFINVNKYGMVTLKPKKD